MIGCVLVNDFERRGRKRPWSIQGTILDISWSDRKVVKHQSGLWNSGYRSEHKSFWKWSSNANHYAATFGALILCTLSLCDVIMLRYINTRLCHGVTKRIHTLRWFVSIAQDMSRWILLQQKKFTGLAWTFNFCISKASTYETVLVCLQCSIITMTDWLISFSQTLIVIYVPIKIFKSEYFLFDLKLTCVNAIKNYSTTRKQPFK